MPGNFAPRSILQNENLISREQPKGAPFASGVWNDIPASEVPADGIAYSEGYIPRPFGLEAASGVLLYSSATLPPLPGRTAYHFTKVGDVVEKTVGEDFEEEDVGNFIVHDDGTHERIEAYLTAARVQVENTDVHAASTAGWVRGPINATEIHRGLNLVLLHIDTRLFWANSAISSYNEIRCVSYRKLSNTISTILEERDNAIVVCSNGFFKVDLSAEVPLYYKINSPNPTTLITDVKKTTAKKYGYKYWYSAARITGDTDIRNRQTSGSVVEHETGTNQYNDSGIDYGQVFCERPVGAADTSYGILTGATLTSPGDAISDWVAITNGQFGISIDGTSYNAGADFSDCKTMADVAARLQGALRAFYETITCEYVEDHFVITNPVENGTVGYTFAGTDGVDIGSAFMKCQSGAGSTTYPNYTQNLTVGPLVCPVDPTETAIPQFHHTHYPIYRSLDFGEEGSDPVSSEGNNEEQAIWLADMPIAKAFVASLSLSMVIASEGSFQPMDVGSKLRFENGTEIGITAYISPSRVMADTAGPISSQAAAIGGDAAVVIDGVTVDKHIRVLTAHQGVINGKNIVTWDSGEKFSASDVGKTIFFAGGLRSHIIAFEDEHGDLSDGTKVVVEETYTFTTNGACMDPKCRYFTDTTPDDELRPRIQNFSLRSRFFEQLPECDSGLYISGWLFGIITNGKDMFYGQIPTNKEYLMGSYNPDQYTTFKDKIKALSEFPDLIVVYMSHSWAAVPTNTYQAIDVNDVLQYYKLSGQWVVDHERGLLDRSLLCKLPDGRDWLVTSEPAIRICDGKEFSPNLAENRVMKILETFQALGAVLYDRFNGISLYGKE